MRIGVSGEVKANTGIGVIQSALYPRLRERGHEIVQAPMREVGSSKLSGRPLHFTTALAWSPASRQLDCFLCLVPPLPVRLGDVPLVSVVHDLRWARTRGLLARCYRRSDLLRTLKRSTSVLAVSKKTLSELQALAPQAELVQATLGPGIVEEDSFADSESRDGKVLLIGKAGHKNNELAAEALVAADPSWLRDVTGVGVSAQTRYILEHGLGRARCTWKSDLSDAEMREVYRAAGTFILLSVEEGFGLPYVEALKSGCQVIAADCAIAREVLGESATFVNVGVGPVNLSEGILSRRIVPQHLRRLQADKYSWDSFTTLVEDTCARSLRTIGG